MNDPPPIAAVIDQQRPKMVNRFRIARIIRTTDGSYRFGSYKPDFSTEDDEGRVIAQHNVVYWREGQKGVLPLTWIS